jgi:serine/threonine-protein kinase RsbW
MIIEIIDSGVPFDVTSLTDPDLTADVGERKIGGLGIFLVKKMVDEVKYRREIDRNILTLTIKKEKE